MILIKQARAWIRKRSSAPPSDLSKAPPNGFSLAEVIVALLVLSLALASTFELFRAGLAYRRLTEATATSIESAMLVKKALDTSLGQVPGALIEVGPHQINYNGQPLIKINKDAITARLERYRPGSRRVQLDQTFALKSPDLEFAPKYGRTSQLTHIVITAKMRQGNTKMVVTPLAISPIYVTASRPCAYDALIGGCSDLAQ
jgi:prepilin-type N-terminal cleavage/methylation domain-containing protein